MWTLLEHLKEPSDKKPVCRRERSKTLYKKAKNADTRAGFDWAKVPRVPTKHGSTKEAMVVN